MGLVGSLLTTMCAGSRLILISPEAFLQRPVRWLNAISRYGADTSGGPNFAYDLCVSRVTADQRNALDLSRWSLAFNGAERVRADTLKRFAETFAPCGFRRNAFYPCYGLAESTLLVSGGRRTDPPVVKSVESAALERGTVVDARDDSHPETVRHIVSCGCVADDQQIAIVDPETATECRAGTVGEIWVSGPSVARGYWERAEETVATFGARLSGSPRPFLRTGDLGFVDGDGLFVTGRLKELIIIDGRNHYPQDIEQTAEGADPAFRMGACAAFAVEADGRERLVIVAEVLRGTLERHDSDRAEATARAIRRVVADVHGVDAHAVRLVRPGGVPRTSSGKVRRSACRDEFLAGTLAVLEGQEVVRPA
jgi:acyl-CoA synthetase (AMP-forming)/AMP-acid ligase II